MEIKDTILVIDDEVQIRRLLEITLTANGYNVAEAANAKDAVVAAATHTPALIILDLGLPDLDGQVVLKQLREWYQKPIIVLSARSSEDEIVKALDSGANDYLTKPFRNGELLARIRSSIRFSNTNEASPILNFGNLSVDLANHTVKKDGEPLKLTSTEFTMLALLSKNAGKVLTHQQLLKEVWGFSYINQTQYLRVFIGQLRKKIEDNPSQPTFIKTESGIGYRFTEGV
ncbi:response regulator [Alistipes sp. ZOR0009]|jgi:two-component system KDP operon response regulator KdpE|uniref:response regulator n=1 Tax=Alistipes sp. ZOR0009 TaxID=1339253 RepID=UPI000645CCF1|nr:response regulator [Alistipes sp. ZOR0009]